MPHQKYNNFVSGFSLLHNHLDGLMARTSANVYLKDLAGKYLAGNECQIARCGVSTYSKLIGLTDHDLSWRDFADTLISHDQQVINNRQATIFIEPVKKNEVDDSKQDDIERYLSYKSPLLDHSGKVIGVFGLSYLLDGTLCSDSIIDELALIVGKHDIDYVKKLISKQQSPTFNLTTRQLDCLRLLAQGMTMKQIGMTLNLSSRTVEHYLEAVKSKLKCGSRTELIAAAFELGIALAG